MKRYVLAGALLFSVGASAQEFRAKMTGRVVDPSGAVVPKAQVIVTNTETGVAVHLQTDKSGEYTAPFLLPGKYSVEVKAAGFSSYLHDGITLLTSQTIQEDAQLTVGSGSEEVRVTADAPLVDASTASVAQVLTAEDIEDLPANGRSPLALAKTELGVIPKAKNADVTSRPFDNSAASDFSIGGGNSQSNEYLLNGVPNMQDSSRVPGFSPQLDSVEAIRVDVFSSDASLGDTSGGTVNLTTKGGTNTYHGTASEFNQFSAINAPQRWFVPVGTVTPATRQNQYGVTLGGPIVIPKLYNGRDKLFFFYSFERFKDSTPNPITSTVPTLAERGGDFSALLQLPKGTSYQLYNPFSGVLTGAANTTITRAAVPGNVILPSQINPVAKAYLQFIPLPNLPGAADGENNFFSNVATIDDYGSHSGRIDVSISDRNKIFFETHRSEYFRTLGNVFANLSTGTTTYTVHQGGLVDYIHTFSPTTTMDIRGSLTRTYSNSSLSSQGFDATTLGFPSYIQTNSTEPILPRIVFSEATGTVAFNNLSTTAGTVSAFDTFQIFGALTKVIGRHTLKIGPDLRLEKYAKLTPGSPSGAFTFGQTFVTSGTGGTAIPFGGSFAEFLFGVPTAGTQTIATPNLYNAAYFAGFLQDDWRALPSLTLNFGLRMEHETPIDESGNRAVVGFNPNAQNSATAGAIAKYAASYNALKQPELPVAAFNPTGGLIYATDGNRSEYNTATVYVSPRVGLAYSPPSSKGQTAIRAGFGIFVNPFNDYNTPQTYGYSQTTAYVPTNNANLTPATTLSDPFPTATNPILQPTGSSLGMNTNLGSGIVVRGPNLRVPYAMRYSLDIQQQLSRGVMLDIGYIGTHQVHLSYTNAISQVGDYPYLSRSHRADPNNTALITTANPCGQTPTQNLQCTITNPFAGLPNVVGAYNTGTTLTKYQLLQSFPEYTGVTQQLVPGASAKFNELLVRLHFRQQYGFNFNANYEWSRGLQTGQLTPGGPLSYQESTSDYPQHFSFEGGYRLPFGRGQKYLSHGYLLSEFVGGFQINAIYQFLSGTPISWGSVDLADGQSFDQNFGSQPRNYLRAFNTGHFYTGTGTGYSSCIKPVVGSGIPCVASDTGQPSTTYNVRYFPQYFLRSDHTDNLDGSIVKNFYAGERFKIEYRFEAFNLFNHTQFGAPNVGPTSSAFGTINTITSINRTLQQGLRVQF